MHKLPAPFALMPLFTMIFFLLRKGFAQC